MKTEVIATASVATVTAMPAAVTMVASLVCKLLIQ